MGNDITAWAWREFSIGNGCPVSPRVVAAGIVSGIFEVVDFNGDREMQRVCNEMGNWRGKNSAPTQNTRAHAHIRFPDFQRFISDQGFQPAFQNCLTRPMQASELAFLLSVTSRCLQLVQEHGFHRDERA